MNRHVHSQEKHEQGLILLMTMFILMLIGVIAIDTIGQSGSESAISGRSRNTIRTLHAADAGIQLAVSRLFQSPPNLDPISIIFAGRTVESRARAVSDAEDLAFAGAGKTPDGLSINIGESYVTEGYEVVITAVSKDGSVAEIESKVTRLDSGEAY